jgi:hypothetical protein
MVVIPNPQHSLSYIIRGAIDYSSYYKFLLFYCYPLQLAPT